MNRAYEQKPKILKKNQYPQAIRMQIYKGPEVGTHQLIVMRIYDDASSTCIAETAHHGVCRTGQRRWASPSDICLLSVLPVDSFGQGDCFEIDKMAEVFTSAHCWCLNTFRNLQHCSSGNLLFTALERLSYDTSLISHWLNTAHWLKVPWRGERGSRGTKRSFLQLGGFWVLEKPRVCIAHCYKLRECSYQKMYTELWSYTERKKPMKSSIRNTVMLPNMAGILSLRPGTSRVLTIL